MRLLAQLLAYARQLACVAEMWLLVQLLAYVQLLSTKTYQFLKRILRTETPQLVVHFYRCPIDHWSVKSTSYHRSYINIVGVVSIKRVRESRSLEWWVIKKRKHHRCQQIAYEVQQVFKPRRYAGSLSLSTVHSVLSNMYVPYGIAKEAEQQIHIHIS